MGLSASAVLLSQCPKLGVKQSIKEGQICKCIPIGVTALENAFLGVLPAQALGQVVPVQAIGLGSG